MPNTRLCRSFLIYVLCSSSPLLYGEYQLQGISFFSPRSQGINAARHDVHTASLEDSFARFYSMVSVVPEFSHSTRTDRISETLFNTKIISVTGSAVVNRGPQDILADYFGLSPTFHSVVVFHPRIQNGIIDFQSFQWWDSIIPDLYTYIYLPVTITSWDFALKETVFDNGSSTPFPANYMDIDPVQAPIHSFKRALQGGVTFGQMNDPQEFGLICGPRTQSGVADVLIGMGCDFMRSDHGHIGLSGFIGVPAGNRPTSRFFFEPLVGCGKQWQAGIRCLGEALVWEKESNQQLVFLGDINISHLFKARQYRSFDFCANGFGSRFILLKVFDASGNYTGQLTPGINHTTLPCHVSTDFQIDLVGMLEYRCNQFIWDFGYNGWIRSKERITILGRIPSRRLGLKGIADVSMGDVLSEATQPCATLMGSHSPLRDSAFISTASLNPHSAASPRVVTHKFFSHIGCTPHYHAHPLFLGVGGEIEFLGINTQSSVSISHTTLCQWGIWVKAGISV